MKKIAMYLLAGMLVLSFSQCGKDGSIGPEGPRGERGERGEKGDKGAKGDDGTSILSGTGAPSSSLGKIGDFYLDLSSNNLYGPKTSSGWGNPTSIQGDKGDKGATGAKGQDGSQFLSGAAAPTASLGKVGDFYFRTSTSLLYGPKTASGWGTGTNLKGAKGDKGDKGDPGNANVSSTGWITLKTSEWSLASGWGGMLATEPDDLGRGVFGAHWKSLSASDLDGVLLVYIDAGRGAFLCPKRVSVKEGSTTGIVEFRFVHTNDTTGANWLYPIVALKSGQWNTTYMTNTYLPSVKWKLVKIPAGQITAHQKQVDFQDYKAVKSAFNLED